jgi:dTDP-4-dehydrorhamnose reductase
MRKVFITGSNGLLGQALVRRFSQSVPVYGCDLHTGSYLGDLYPYDYFKVDITNRNEFEPVVAGVRPDVLINAAAYTNVDRSEDEKELCWLRNVHSLEVLFDSIRNFSPLLVQISTDYIFNGKEAPYRENDPAQPLGYYGHTKYMAERVVRGSKLEYIIARSMILYGHGLQIRPNFALWVINQLRARKPIPVVTDQIGNPTFIDELAEALFRLIQQEEYGVFHIAGREVCSRYDFARKIADVFKLDKSLIQPVTTAELSQKAPRPANAAFTLDKLYNTLDWLPANINDSLLVLKSQLN